MARKRKKSKGRKKRRNDKNKGTGASEEEEQPTTSGEDGSKGEGRDAPAEGEGADGEEAEGEGTDGKGESQGSDEGTEPEEDEGDEPGERPETDESEGTDEPGPGQGTGEKVAAVIEVEEELDDPEARAELIALAAGLETTEETLDPDAADEAEAEEAAEPASEGAPEEPEGDHEEEDAEAVEAPDGSDAAGEEEEEEASDGPDDDDMEEEARPSTDAGDEGQEEGPLIGRDALVALTQFRDEGVATMPEELVLDLGDAASPEERDRLLAAALAHAEMQEAIYRVPTESGAARRWKGLVAGALLTLALLIIPLPPGFLVPEAPPALSTSERTRGLRTALLLQAEQIEAFRAREDRLPRSLNEVETALPGIRYVRSSDRLYQLVTHTPDGEAIIFDSAAPDAEFGELERVLPQRASS